MGQPRRCHKPGRADGMQHTWHAANMAKLLARFSFILRPQMKSVPWFHWWRNWQPSFSDLPGHWPWVIVKAEGKHRPVLSAFPCPTLLQFRADIYSPQFCARLHVWWGGCNAHLSAGIKSLKPSMLHWRNKVFHAPLSVSFMSRA